MPRILLAKDDNVVRDMRQAVLERDGFEGVAVANVTRSAQPYSQPVKRGTGSPHCARN
jgi:CheY-like chemotaxis protein